MFIAFTLISSGMSSCSKKSQQSAAESYKTLSITTADATFNEEYTATLKGVQAVEVRPQVSGTITKICVAEGASVRKGQLMFVIDQTPYKAAVDNAKASLANCKAALASARLTLKSKKQLREAQVVGDYDVEQAQNSVNEAQANLQSAQASLLTAQNNLSYTEVRSPANGVIGMIPYRVGALVSSSIEEPLATVADNSEIHAYFSISESGMQKLLDRYGSLQEALKRMPSVKLRMSNGETYSEPGHVDAIAGNVDATTGSVTLRATFSNPKGVLRNGGTGTIIMPYVVKNSIIIPQEATYELQDKVFVYKVVDGKTKSTSVSVLDLDDGQHYVVTNGLRVGDIIVAEGAGLLHDGIAIQVKK